MSPGSRFVADMGALVDFGPGFGVLERQILFESAQQYFEIAGFVIGGPELMVITIL